MPKMRKNINKTPEGPDYELAQYVASLTLELHKMAMHAGYETVCTHLSYAYYAARGISTRFENNSKDAIARANIDEDTDASRAIY